MAPDVGTQPRAPDIGLCGSCRNARLVRSDRGFIFYQCKLAVIDPRFPKYPLLPVVSCPGYKEDGVDATA